MNLDVNSSRPAVPELVRRLYPHSWIFALIKSLPQMIPILFAAGILGKQDSLWVRLSIVIVMIAVLVGYQIILTKLTHWEIANQAVFVRTGVFNKDTKVIPFNRIQNVKITQNPLHRVFGVARVELESAGSKKPEATFEVLRHAEAHALSQLVQSRGRVDETGAPTVPAESGEVLLHMPLGELIRFGIVSNRGMIVVAAAAGATFQFADDIGGALLKRWIARMNIEGQVDRFVHLPVFDMVVLGLGLIGLLIVFVRLLSIALAFWSHWNFTLTEQPRRLRTERGLVARWHDAIVKSRIQSWRIREGIWHRLVKRQTVDVDTMAGSDAATNEDGTPRKQTNHLLPVATPQRAAQIVTHLAPELAIEGRDWQRIESKNFWRLLAIQMLYLVPALIGTQVLAYFIEPTREWVNSPLYWLAMAIWAANAVFDAWFQVRFHAFSIDQHSFAVRRGWLSRKWHFAEIKRTHALSVSQGPTDRWFGTATLVLDTPGAARGVMQMKYLPYERAVALRDAIALELNKSISKSL